MPGVALPSAETARAKTRLLFPGIAVATLVAWSAQFLAEHYDTPAMLLALLLGIAVSFLGEEGKAAPGIAFSARMLLRVGVALLGARISFALIMDLGPAIVGMIVGSVALTIGFGLLISRLFGHGWRFGFLTAGSVAICGASAAMAIAAILPQDDKSEQRLIFTVMGVTVLSTLAMILYPILSAMLGFDDLQTGVFLGGTIHDVAQVVGAGFSVSEPAGEAATLVKLMRVTLLAPVVLIAALLLRGRNGAAQEGGSKPPLLPGFVLAFLALATINSLGWLPAALGALSADLSRWLLLIAVAAVGMKTNLKEVLQVGGLAIGLLVTETLFLALLFILGITLLM